MMPKTWFPREIRGRASRNFREITSALEEIEITDKGVPLAEHT
jgi:hypothetical protein